MSADDYYERLDSCLSEVEDPNYSGYGVPVMELRNEALLEERPLTAEQRDALWSRAIEHLSLANKSHFPEIAHIISYATKKLDTKPIASSLLYHRDKEGHPSGYEIMIHMLRDAGVFEAEEDPLYYEYGRLGVNSADTGRGALLVLTNKRLLAAGRFAGQFSCDRLFYDDWKEKPFVTNVDYVYLDGLTDVKLKKKSVEGRYRSKYVRVRERTFFGPYFFKLDLLPSFKIKEGKVRIHASAEVMMPLGIHPNLEKVSPWLVKVYHRWNTIWQKKGLTPAYNENRLNALYEKIVEVQSGEGPVLR